MDDVNTPSDYLDLEGWKLTLPVDAHDGNAGTAREITGLMGYENPKYFFTDAAGEVDFYAPVDGATTSGSHYARSELRELDGRNLAGWTVNDGGTMAATLEVKQAPVKDDGSTGRMVVGQIHGQSDELARLYWDNGTVYAVSDHAGPRDNEINIPITDTAGNSPDVPLNQAFSYRLNVSDGRLSIDVYSGGRMYSASTPISDTWNNDRLYFKSGVYLGVGRDGSSAGTTGHGAGEVGFLALQVGHGTTQVAFPPGASTPTPLPPSGPNPPPAPPSDPEPPIVTEPISLSGTSDSDTLQGGDGDDSVKGRGGDDTLVGGGGSDTIWGNAGDDTLIGGTGDDWLKGGTGKDTYVFDAGSGRDVIDEFRSDDTLKLIGSPFSSIEAAKSASTQTSDGVVLDLRNNSSILFAGSSIDEVAKAHWQFT